MRFTEKEMSFPKTRGDETPLSHIERQVSSRLGEEGLLPVRVAVTDSSGPDYRCEVGVLSGAEISGFDDPAALFRFEKRKFENTREFNVVFLVPTGIGCEIGGHAGDATPVARLLSSCCDNLITHPNVFNASDINEMPENSLYVEGSAICRLMMGSAGLRPVRSNRVLAVIDENEHEVFENAAVNSVNAARATLGMECSGIVRMSPSVTMRSEYSSSSRAVGVIEGVDNLFSVLRDREGSYDAVAISSVIKVPESYHLDYFRSGGEMVNPWGGVEAMLTHAVSYGFDVPSAHSPMFESPEISNMDPGIVEARMSAEAVSNTFFHCVLKGLHGSPGIVTDPDVFHCDGIISAKDVSCLVVPDGCLGLPTLAALEQGIKVVAVKENRNLMRNDLGELPWAAGQFVRVENYLEAAGVLNSIKSGISLSSVRRPFETLNVSEDAKGKSGKERSRRSRGNGLMAPGTLRAEA